MPALDQCMTSSLNARICLEAMARADIREVRGIKSNPMIVAMIRRVLPKFKGSDATAWCSAWMLEVALAAGADFGTRQPNAAAISWRRAGRGIPLNLAQAGDVAILSRPGAADWQRHVGVFCRFTDRGFVLFGGNQRNRSCFGRYAIGRLQEVRRLSEA